MQADFTDRPEELPDLIKRFEGGADVVVEEREISASWPSPVRLLVMGCAQFRAVKALADRLGIDRPQVVGAEPGSGADLDLSA